MQQLKKIPIVQKINLYFESLPKPKTEESILLRILVQILVIIGIIATDVAANAQISIWAVPCSIIGAYIAWRRRKKKNIEIKFLLAIGMIVTLFLFFGELIANIFDNRLVLAQFLIKIQVLHSFDLPRRKDLGYSMIIGLILIGVAGTLSQTLAFAPWLILFLLFAIPTLILDYRSRLNLPPWEKQFQKEYKKQHKKDFIKHSSLSPKKLVWFPLIIIALGLTIFTIMPRYPGYQLSSFPVKAPDGMENTNFSSGSRGIVNPGYNNEEGSDNLIDGGNNSTGKGEIDSDFYYGFNTKINQNLRGKMTKKKIVLRIRSQAPGFWRALAFDKYNGQGWEISRDDQLIDVPRNRWNYRFKVNVPFVKSDTKRIIQTYTVVSDLPNIIPVLSYPSSIYFPTQEIGIDPENSLRSPAGLIEGLTYTTISRVPYRSQTQLSEASIKYSDTIKNYYLQIPDDIKDEVKEKTEELLAKTGKLNSSNYDKAMELAQTLKQNYTIQDQLRFFDDKEDLVKAFLFRDGGGYPDHFSTVYTMMLRSIGIPARLVVGFDTGQFNPFTGYYVVHNTDAYAMTEVYFPGYGWFYFDPLPAHEIIPRSFQEDQTFGVLGQLWKWVASWLPSPIIEFVTIFFERVIKGIFQFLANIWLNFIWRFISGSIFGIFIGIIGFMLFSFLVFLSWKGLQNLFYRRRLAKLTPIERIYREMLDLMKTKGYPKNPAQTPLEYANIIYQHQQTIQAEIIEEICQNYVYWRYGNLTPNITHLQQQFKALQKSFKLVKVTQK